MPGDFTKLEEKFLALSQTQRIDLLRKLIGMLDSDSASGAGQTLVQEVRVQYESHPEFATDTKAMQKVIDASSEPARETGGTMDQFDRITQQAGLMGGKACIRGMRVTVGMIVSQIAAGANIDALLAEYPYLEHEDIVQALRYAAWRTEEREVILNPV